MTNIDTRNLDATAGAVYFTVGRGTEGGSASYRLSVAGVSGNEWGTVSAVAANSGYSIGTIQVDLGQRGTWPLGAIRDRPLNPGETTYVDAIIGQASAYARQHGLRFTDDQAQLRADLLSHGDGGLTRGGTRRSSITFIDADTRDSINAWAASDEGKRWIHANIDYPQVRNATQTAMTILDRDGRNIPEDRRFEAINILAKTANQYPGGLDRLQGVLRNGGDYDALLGEARAIQGAVSFYAGPKAASVAEGYEANYADPNRRQAMDRAHAQVSRPNYDPTTERNNPDVQQALASLPGRTPSRANTVLEQGESGREVRKLESNLAGLGITDAQSRPLQVDGQFTAETKQAVEAYQRGARLEPVDGKAGPATLGSIDREVRGLQNNLRTLGALERNGQPLTADGYYGDGTRDAVRTFQQTHGINPTGIADEATRRAVETAARERAQGQTQTTPQPAQATPPQPAQTAPPQPAQATPAQPAQATPPQPAQTAPPQPAQTTPPQPGAQTPPANPAPAAQGPQSFNDVMRIMLPPQNGVAPHITSDFGPRILNGQHDDHGGVDFNYVGGQSGANLRHPTVRSPVSGEVVFSGGSYGTVKIRDDQGNMHEILHMDSRSVQVTNPPTRVQAGDPIGTMGGRGPGGAGDYAQHVHYQMRDPNGRLLDPEAYWNNPQRAQGHSQDPLADGRLQRSERGDSVRQLQEDLTKLGVQFRDNRGQPIAPTGFYGTQTETAVRDFQRGHDLPQTGIADEATRRAIETAARERTQGQTQPAPATPAQPAPAAPAQPGAQTAPATPAQPGAQTAPATPAQPGAQTAPATPVQPGAQTAPVTPAQPGAQTAPANPQQPQQAGSPDLLTNPQNPNNPLFNQVLRAVQAAERERGVVPGEHSERLAAALTVEAVRERINRVDRVELSRDGSLARVVQNSPQGNLSELNIRTDAISTQQALQQPMRESSEQATQVLINIRAQDQHRSQQEQERRQQPAAMGYA
ncbi:peptidoglycan-binding protein [Luteimonas panaciterrae]|uniref:peptidoglycan-binding protein n=1 Tax=Luteimonas panaciterrae TaxID=363885 RepID=UPI001CF99847|nr:peptidoglycan-binding protein [Luteimonas panaciterrae]